MIPVSDGRPGRPLRVASLTAPAWAGLRTPAGELLTHVRHRRQLLSPEWRCHCAFSVARPFLSLLDGVVTGHEEEQRISSASREITAGAEQIFELIADPAQQPRWDGNDNLVEAVGGQGW
mgnify:CR=1 FL=1